MSTRPRSDRRCAAVRTRQIWENETAPGAENKRRSTTVVNANAYGNTWILSRWIFERTALQANSIDGIKRGVVAVETARVEPIWLISSGLAGVKSSESGVTVTRVFEFEARLRIRHRPELSR